jgi:hypothetical protein
MQTAQPTGRPHRNQGLFSDHYLNATLPMRSDWRGLPDLYRERKSSGEGPRSCRRLPLRSGSKLSRSYLVDQTSWSCECPPVALDGFEVWDKSTQAPAGQSAARAFVSISPAGTIAPNRYAREMLPPGTEAVKLMYDEGRKRLGFVPTDPEAENAFDWPNRYGSGQIAASKFCEHYGIRTAETTRFYGLAVLDGILVVDIGESTSTPANSTCLGRTGS